MQSCAKWLLARLSILRLKTCAWLIVVCFSLRMQAQTDVFTPRLIVKMPLLSLIDLYSGSSPRLGVEYKLKGRHYLYNEAGTYFPNFNGVNNNKGITAKLEYKCYYWKEAYNDKPSMTQFRYVSAELFYKYQSYTSWDTILLNPNYRADYRVFKTAACFTIKMGWMNVFKNGIVMDLFAGLGLRYRVVNSTLSDEENGHIKSSGDYSINKVLNMKGSGFGPNLDAGVKIGYCFR